MDENISKLEGTCPGPRLATCEAWIEHLQSRRNDLLGVDSRLLNDPPAKAMLSNQATASAPVNSLAQQPVLPSHVVDNNEMYIDGFTSEQPLPYNNNNAVAIGTNGGVKLTGDQQNGFLPTNYMTSNVGGSGVGAGTGANGYAGKGGSSAPTGMGPSGPRLFSSNNIVAKTPSQDLLNVSKCSRKLFFIISIFFPFSSLGYWLITQCHVNTENKKYTPPRHNHEKETITILLKICQTSAFGSGGNCCVNIIS